MNRSFFTAAFALLTSMAVCVASAQRLPIIVERDLWEGACVNCIISVGFDSLGRCG